MQLVRTCGACACGAVQPGAELEQELEAFTFPHARPDPPRAPPTSAAARTRARTLTATAVRGGTQARASAQRAERGELPSHEMDQGTMPLAAKCCSMQYCCARKRPPPNC